MALKAEHRGRRWQKGKKMELEAPRSDPPSAPDTGRSGSNGQQTHPHSGQGSDHAATRPDAGSKPKTLQGAGESIRAVGRLARKAAGVLGDSAAGAADAVGDVAVGAAEATGKIASSTAAALIGTTGAVAGAGLKVAMSGAGAAASAGLSLAAPLAPMALAGAAFLYMGGPDVFSTSMAFMRGLSQIRRGLLAGGQMAHEAQIDPQQAAQEAMREKSRLLLEEIELKRLKFLEDSLRSTSAVPQSRMNLFRYGLVGVVILAIGAAVYVTPRSRRGRPTDGPRPGVPRHQANAPPPTPAAENVPFDEQPDPDLLTA